MAISKQTRREIETLAAPRPDARMERLKELINNRLADFLETSQANHVLNDYFASANRIFLSPDAKRVRGLIPLLICERFDLDLEFLLRYAVIIEMLHFTSLVHDDVIDQDDSRRGYPSLNSLYSQTEAILIGDYFMCDIISHAMNSNHNQEVIGLTTSAIRELITGVIMEKSLLAREPSYPLYREMALKKTGSLFGLSFGLPFVSRPELGPALDCGRHFGLLFQIYDDHHDRTTDSTQENIFHLLPEAEVSRICQEDFSNLLSDCRRLGMETVLADTISYLQNYGYFLDISLP